MASSKQDPTTSKPMRGLRALMLRPDVDDQVKHFLSLSILIVALVYTLIAGIYAWTINNYFLTLLDTFFAISLTIALVLTLNRPRNKSANIIVSIASLLAFLSFFVSGGDHGTGYLWSLIVPLASSYLLGFKSGLRISVAYLAALLTLFLSSKVLNIPAALPEDRVMVRFLGIYLLLTLFQTGYEFTHRAITRHLNTEKDNFKAILAASPVALLVVNQDRQVLQSNHAARKLFAQEGSMEQVFRCGEFIDCIDQLSHSGGCGFGTECSDCELNKGIKSIFSAGPAINDQEMCLSGVLTDNDKPLWLRYSIEPVTINHLDLVVVAMSDISDLKELNQKAQEMEKKANAANVAKTEFLANISHELRTPMNGIIGMNSILLGSGLNEEQLQYAQTVRQCSSSLLTLLNDILDYTKLEVGKLDLSIINFDMLQLIDDVMQSMMPKAQEKSLRLAWTAAVDLPVLLKGDPGRLRQIISHLLDNAIKFTHQGEVVLKMAWSQDTDSLVVGGINLHARVIDTGIGIEDDKISMLFNKFVQVDASSTRHFGGTGLGLAICKELCELMNGKIGLTSKHGQGSEFWFDVKLVLQAMPSQPCQVAAPHDQLDGVKILILDDSSEDRFLLDTNLRAWSMRVHQAKHGSQALNMLTQAAENQDPFAMVIVEQDLAEMSGLELGRTIRLDQNINQTILLLTHCRPERGDANQARAAGFDVYLPKPIEANDLHDCLVSSRKKSQTKLITRHSVREDHLAERYAQKRSGRLLLADDDEVNRTLMLIYLSKLGYQCDTVENGQEVLQNLTKQDFDLVLMDINMPVMSGLQASTLIRDISSSVRNHQIPVIAMTASNLKGDKEECLRHGMNDFMSKPVDFNTLAEILDKWLTHGSQAPQGQQAPPEPAQSLGTTFHAFDQSAFLKRVGGQSDLAQQVIEIFLRESEQDYRDLMKLAQKSEKEKARKLAHKLKGSAANLNLESLRSKLQAIEQCLECGFDDLESLVEEVQLEYEASKLELQAWLKLHKIVSDTSVSPVP